MRTLLLADDSTTIQRVVALIFADEAVQVVAVSNGQEAIDWITSQPPDIVLAGTKIPNVDGYEVARFVRSQSSLSGVPVLLLSGAFELVDQARLTSSGASGVLEKPLEPAIVISRVKELLGLKGDARPTVQMGRLVTSADTPSVKKPPPRVDAQPASLPVESLPLVGATAASAWGDLRQASGLEPDAGSVEAAPGAGREDYRDTLDAAFDSLDEHLAARGDERPTRNPAPPLAHDGTVADPRSPNRRPQPVTPRQPSGANPIFEVDDDWFADDERAKDERRDVQKQLAAEMGIHDVELPDNPDSVNTAASAADLDLDFGVDGESQPTMAATAAPDPEPLPSDLDPPPAPSDDQHDPVPVDLDAPGEPESVAFVAPPPAPVFVGLPEPTPVVPVMPAAPAPMPGAPGEPLAMLAPLHASRDVADDFAALLAFEQGEQPHPALPAPEEAAPAAIVPAPAPVITDAMLDQIAARVVDRLQAGSFVETLREAITATVKDTVRTVVSETSERLVRDEIARIRSNQPT